MMEWHVTEIIAPGSMVQWGVAIPQYFFLTGISAAAFLVSSLTYAFGRKEYEPVAGLSLVLAFTVLVVAPLNLIADLGQPGRFYSLFYHLHATSPMSWGVFLLTTYPALIAVEMYFVFREGFARRANQGGARQGFFKLLALGDIEVSQAKRKRDHAVGRVLGMIGIPAALAVHGYTGYILGVVKARPLWHTSLMPLIFLVSAMVSGIALIILLAAILVRNEEGRVDWPLMERLGVLLGWSIVGDLLLRLLWYTIGLGYSTASFAEAFALIFEHHFTEAIVLELGLGLLFPLLVMAVPGLRRVRPLFLVASLLAVAGVMLFRWDTVIGGQLLPKTGAGFYSFMPPFWGRTGIMHILGNWGLWLFLFIVFLWLTPWRQAASHEAGVLDSSAAKN